MSTAQTNGPRLQVGGHVRIDALYLEREADRELFDALASGRLCAVLAPRQVGKSSLRLRVAKRLSEELQFRCVTIDLTGLGRTGSANQWYLTLATTIADQLDLADPEEYWDKHHNRTNISVLKTWFTEKLIPKISENVVIFIDEIDVMLSLDFDRSEFFAALRSLSEERSTNDDLRRLNFCVIGVATPISLVEDHKRTPFNTAVHIELRDFRLDQLGPLLSITSSLPCNSEKLIESIFEWTNGHPAHMCRLLDRVVKAARERSSLDRINEAAFVAQQVEHEFLNTLQMDPIYIEVDRRFPIGGDSSNRNRREIISIYEELLLKGVVTAQLDRAVINEMKIAGLISERPKAHRIELSLRSKIFRLMFDEKWVKDRQSRTELASAIDEWKRNREGDGFLLEGKRLERIVKKVQNLDSDRRYLTYDEQIFILKSEERQRLLETERRLSLERARRNGRIFVTIGLGLIVVAIAVGVLIMRSDAGSLTLDNEALRRQVNTLMQQNARLNDMEVACVRKEKESNEARRAKENLENIFKTQTSYICQYLTERKKSLSEIKPTGKPTGKKTRKLLLAVKEFVDNLDRDILNDKPTPNVDNSWCLRNTLANFSH